MSAGVVEGLDRWAARAPHSLWLRALHRTTTGVVGIVGLSLMIGACGNGGGEQEGVSVEASIDGGPTTVANTALPACKDVRHMVAFSVFGAATEAAGDDVSRWASDPENLQPVARPGAAAVATAYRDLGYHLLYVGLHPADTRIGDRPLVEAVTVWLGLNGFPIGGYDTHVWAWDGQGEPEVALTEHLSREAAGGAELAAGYVGDANAVFPFVTGGIPRDRMFTVNAGSDGETSTSLPSDLTDHVSDVQRLDLVCE